MRNLKSQANAAAAAKLKKLGASGRKGYAFGGMVGGDLPMSRNDRPDRSGGAKKGSTVVNVVVAPGPQEPPTSPMLPPAAGAAPPVPPPRPPPMPPQMGPGGPGGPGGPMPMPPGALPPPGIRNMGGRIGYKKGGAVHSDEAEDKPLIKAAVHKHEKAMHKGNPLTALKRGGTAKAMKKYMAGGRVKLDAGAGTGEGRLEISRATKK